MLLILDLHKFYQIDKNPHFVNKARQKQLDFIILQKELLEWIKI